MKYYYNFYRETLNDYIKFLKKKKFIKKIRYFFMKIMLKNYVIGPILNLKKA